VAGSDEHPKPLRLFDLVRDGGGKITHEEESIFAIVKNANA
jgi:hypothetical protein